MAHALGSSHRSEGTLQACAGKATKNRTKTKRDYYEKKEMDIEGRVDVSDELCDDGSEALSIVTDDGDEYIIKSRKMIKHLMKYAYVDDLKIKFHGFARLDTDGIVLFTVTGYKLPEITKDQRHLLSVEEESGASERQRHSIEKDEDGEDGEKDKGDGFADYQDGDGDYGEYNDEGDQDEDLEEDFDEDVDMNADGVSKSK